jgi:hypothetical protein
MNKYSPVVMGILLLLTASTPIAAGQSNLPECNHYAFTIDSSNTHYSLIRNGSINIGQNLFVDSNCEFTISLNGLTFNNQTFFSQSIPLDLTTFSITENGITTTYSNLTFYPSDDINFIILESNKDKTTTDSELFTSELLAHIITIIILFFLSTSLVYRAARNRVENTIEVVI